MPHGAPPPPPAPAVDETRFPVDEAAAQVGVLTALLAAGASVAIPGVREDFGIVEALVGTDVAGSLLLDYVPLRTPASSSLYLPFAEPVLPGAGGHTITNTTGGPVNVSIYVVAKRRITTNGHHPRPTPALDPPAEADEG